MIAFNWFGQDWVIPGANTAFLVSLIAATLLTLVGDSVRQAPPARHAGVVG